ncbi:hypothetical protein HZS92_03177 [Xanthomonas citri pv. citri]|nr:hypothetical protein HZS91_03232 [Xanthomonas citri pv. citri]QYF41066.1 hypothetical protein HZS92_03177 [Xanthomonas citri pv. citri]QYF45882.1 hypothetical protein HZS93_03214 [Xanthomonas citri]CCG37992.1 hypothetical protein XMIN_2983 [Xanthomonas citri pv. mangiferaeindicae LMG 941]
MVEKRIDDAACIVNRVPLHPPSAALAAWLRPPRTPCASARQRPCMFRHHAQAIMPR